MVKGLTALKKYWPVVAAIVGVLLMLIPFGGNENKPDDNATVSTATEYYSEHLEKKIKALICEAKGVGEATVVVTLDRTAESVLAQNEKLDSSGCAVDYVIISGEKGEEAVPVAEIYPTVRGVGVVCTGGGDAKVRKRVVELISAALGISTNKISVSG